MAVVTSNSSLLYKGKVTNRSWSQLPEDLLRHIATLYLWDISARSYCPTTWDARENWHHRMVYTTLRDANDLERHMMSICPQWHKALQQHLFWHKAIALIDPGDILAHHAIIHPRATSVNSSSTLAMPIKITPYRHFRNITTCSCLVCRINSPSNNAGLTIAKRHIRTPYLYTIALCREHERRPASFCGLCLRTAPVFENVLSGVQAAAAAVQENMIGVIDNDDKDSFPNVEATCRTCRLEWLWKRASDSPRDMEAIGGNKLVSDDWETRNIVDSFIDLAEGNIKDILLLAREKLWLRKHTRLNDMLEQALAASRYNRTRRGYDAIDQEEEEEEDEEEEDDIELLQMEESGARDLALGDWARARILDGHWFSPADTWYNHTVPGKPTHVSAVHPCPWTRDPSSFSSSSGDEEEDEHPRSSTLNAEIPPTYILCEQAFLVHQRQMRDILVAPMRNLVRKIIIECQTPGPGHRTEDPAVRAARMSMDEVLTELREEEGLWFDGFDWVERRMNDRREREKRGRDAVGSTMSSDDSSTSSNGSRSSNGTSPVLSTTTLQTTPSPPPISQVDDKKEDEDAMVPETSAAISSTVPVMMYVAPVLDPPKLLRPIPFIPITASHFPPYTMEALKIVWREACSPLYHCRCSICLRAALLANAGNNTSQGQGPPLPLPTVVPTQVPPPVLLPIAKSELHPVVKLEESLDLDGDGEEEIEVLEEDMYEDPDGEDMEEVGEEDGYEELESGSERDEDETESSDYPATFPLRTTSIVIPRPRKRSSDEVDNTLDDDEALLLEITKGTSSRDGTPPKRARTDDQVPSADSGRRRLSLEPDSPSSIRKRSSEELEDLSDESVTKRIRISQAIVKPPTPTAEDERGGESDQSKSPPSTSEISRPSSAQFSTRSNKT